MTVKRKQVLIALIIGILTSISIVIIIKNPYNFFGLFPKYKTQKVIYINKNNPDLTIEIQLKEVNNLATKGLGQVYVKRTIMRDKNSFFNPVKAIDISKIDLSEWKAVDIVSDEFYYSFPID